MTNLRAGDPAASQTFLGKPIPRAFGAREVILAPGAERAYDDAEWRDAIVAVQRGEVELECLGGGCHRVLRGDLLWLSGLPLRVLRNAGDVPAVLVAVSRRGRDEFCSAPRSHSYDYSDQGDGHDD